MADCPSSPARSDAWDLIKDDWSPTEMSQTVMLVTKARRLGLMDDVMKAVYQEENARAMVTKTNDATGSMNDSSKRLREAMPAVGYAEGMSPSPKTYFSPPCSTWNPPMSVSAAPYGMNVAVPPGVTLPEGVNSMDEWGCSMVSFGKFKGRKSYREILQDDSEDMVSYKKYLYDHYGHGSSQLRDLTAFLMASGYTQFDSFSHGQWIYSCEVSEAHDPGHEHRP
eukprot:s252_g21.t1